MKNIYTKDFLLTNVWGKRLFHEVAESLPIIDWHNHVDPALLANRKPFENIYQLWIQHDPYKHRAMRIYGISESLITGQEASDYDKFLAWATCLPQTLGNPLFHWSCMELKQVFGLEVILTPENAPQIWALANRHLQQTDMSALDILSRFGLEMLCTSDDLLDPLNHHIAIAECGLRIAECGDTAIVEGGFRISEGGDTAIAECGLRIAEGGDTAIAECSDMKTSEGDDTVQNQSITIPQSAIHNPQSAIRCLPSLRSDSIINFNQPTFFQWLERLENLTQIKVGNLNAYKQAIIHRLDFFDKTGCLLSDHSLDSGFKYVSTSAVEAETDFERFLTQKSLSEIDLIRLQSHLLHFLGLEYAKRQWKLQLHIGAHRFTSTRLRNKVGAAGGYACIGNTADMASLSRFLDDLDVVNGLPKTILYTLNPADNAAFASLTGSFSEDYVRGKIQFGPAWWYNDHYEGILQQLSDLSAYGLLSTTIGFTTDSRSILSFTRHDYYRRILCNWIGQWVEDGKLPDDEILLKQLVKNIAYFNIKNWIQKKDE